MRADPQAVLTAMARFFAPLVMVFGALLLLIDAPLSGVGFLAALPFALVLILHVIVRGASAARDAFPPAFARTVLGCAIGLALAGVGAPRWTMSPQLVEAGAFLSTVAATALVVVALSGRVPALMGDAQE